MYTMVSDGLRRSALSLGVVGLVASAMLASGGPAPAPQSGPVLVELFTSEGCSSCPPADRLLETLVDDQPVGGVAIIGLGEHVDYWDRLGWKDRFSSPASTNRQQRYARTFNIDSIYTPQMIVDGRNEFVGSDAKAVRRAIAKSMSAPHGVMTIVAEPPVNDHVAVSITVAELPQISRGDHADLVLAVTEGQLRSDVRGGENKGHVLNHAAVVRQMTAVGEVMRGQPARADLSIASDWQRNHLTIVAFVQERLSGHVLCAAATSLQSADR